MIIVFCKTFYFVNENFFFIFFIRDVFVSLFFQKSIRLDLGGPLLLKSNILLSELPEVAIHMCLKTF